MKKVLSWILFILTVIIFIFDIYFTVEGTIEVRDQFDRLEARGEGGIEYLGVGVDVLVMWVILITAVGLAFAFASSKLAQKRAVEIVSIALFLLFIPAVFLCFCFAFYL